MSEEIEELKAKIAQLEKRVGSLSPHMHSGFRDQLAAISATPHNLNQSLPPITPCTICGQRWDAPIHQMKNSPAHF